MLSEDYSYMLDSPLSTFNSDEFIYIMATIGA